MMGVIAILLVAIITSTCETAWQENVRPKMYVQLGESTFFLVINYPEKCLVTILQFSLEIN